MKAEEKDKSKLLLPKHTLEHVWRPLMEALEATTLGGFCLILSIAQPF